MKILVLTLSILVETLASSNFADEWNSFKAEHQKAYKSQKDELARRAIFFENKRAIEAHNELYSRREVSYKLGVNEFSDLHPDEFKAAMLGNKRLKKGASKRAPLHLKSARDIPGSVDWRSLNPKAVYPVQCCEACESSWAYSAIASLAGQLYLRKGLEVPPLSAQNLIDCTYSLGNSGCEGGTVENAFIYIKTNGGLDTEESYFYRDGDEQCEYNATTVVSSATVTGYVELPSGDETALLDAVSNLGPVAVSVGAYDNAFMLYKGGIYDPDPSTCSITPGNLHHMVLLVGYGSEGGKDFWIIQNSWGSSWGEGGYMRLIRNGKNTCGIATQALYPTVE